MLSEHRALLSPRATGKGLPQGYTGTILAYEGFDDPAVAWISLGDKIRGIVDTEGLSCDASVTVL